MIIRYDSKCCLTLKFTNEDNIKQAFSYASGYDLVSNCVFNTCLDCETTDWLWASSMKKVLSKCLGRNQAKNIWGASDPEPCVVDSNSDLPSPQSHSHLCLLASVKWLSHRHLTLVQHQTFYFPSQLVFPHLNSLLQLFSQVLGTKTWEWSFHSSLLLIAQWSNPDHFQIQFLYLQ